MTKRRFVTVVLGFAALSFGAAYLVDRALCLGRWGSYGHAVGYGIVTGCRVEVSPGRWVPVSAIRDLDVRP